MAEPPPPPGFSLDEAPPSGFIVDTPPNSAPTADAPAQVEPVGYKTIGGFNDELPAHATPLPEDLQKQVVSILANDPVETAATHARELLRPLGIFPAAASDSKYRDNFDEVMDYRRKHGVVSDSVINQLMSPQQAAEMVGTNLEGRGAGVRGAADAATGGLLNHVDAAAHAAVDALTGQDKGGVVNDFNRWEDVNQSILHADEANHPDARLVGQIIGGMALPSGMEGTALQAGKDVLRSGGTMIEARAAAAAAARNRIAVEGGGYGAVHGAATADPGNRAAGAVSGGVMGAAGGYAMARVAQAAKPAVEAVRELIGPGTEATGDAAQNIAGNEVPDTPQGHPDYVKLARTLNIRRTPATNSRTGVATVLQSGLDALPGGSPAATAAKNEIGDLGTAAKAVAEQVGPVSTRQGAGEAVAEGAQAYKTTSGSAAKSLYGQRDALIGGATAPVVLHNFDQSINDLAAQFPGSPAVQQLREHPVIRRLTDAFDGMPGREATLGEATEALSHIRGVIRNLDAKADATPVVISRVRKVEQALESDVMDSARAADVAAGREPGAEGSAVAAQKAADSFYADRASALNGSLKKPLASAKDDTKVSGEAVYNQVLGDMNIKSGNLSRLRDSWFRLPPPAKSTFAATAIDDLGRAKAGQQNDVGNEWSFETFLTNLNTLSPQARNIVFGAKADADLQKVAAYASRLRDLGKARNFSNTAKKYFAGAFFATVGGAVMHGDLSGATEALFAIPATWGGAKLLLSTPKMRDWTIQAMKAMTSGNDTAMRVLTKKLGTIAATEPTIAGEVTGLQRAIQQAANDNLHRLAASTGNQQPNSKRKKAAATR